MLNCELLSGRLGVEVTSAAVIRHKPGRRVLVAYETALGPLLGKLRVNHRATTPFRLLSSFVAHGFSSHAPDGIIVPEPVAVLEDLGLWLQRLVDGYSATDVFRAGATPGSIALARRAARAAHKIHRAGVPTRRTHNVVDELRVLENRLFQVEAGFPHLAPRVRSVREGSRALAASLGKRPSAGIHRDFYPDQLVVGSPMLTIVDFDLYCEGDPAVDVGNFLAHLTEFSLRTWGDPMRLRACEDAMLDEYMFVAGEEHESAIRAYETLTLARHISLSTELPGRYEFTEVLLTLTEERLFAR